MDILYKRIIIGKREINIELNLLCIGVICVFYMTNNIVISLLRFQNDLFNYCPRSLFYFSKRIHENKVYTNLSILWLKIKEDD